MVNVYFVHVVWKTYLTCLQVPEHLHQRNQFKMIQFSQRLYFLNLFRTFAGTRTDSYGSVNMNFHYVVIYSVYRLPVSIA